MHKGTEMEQCRAITFINFHIPRTEMADDGDIQYSTVGFFDGMLTEKIEIDKDKGELKNLWKYALKRTAKSVGQYSYQNIFCFGVDGDNSCADKEIWAEETDRNLPLTFIIFLQLQKFSCQPESITGQCRELNKKAGEKLKDGEKYYTYSTVDKNDFVVCIKCRNYRKAVEAIKNLHTIENNVVYSYSVFSISNKVLENFDREVYKDLFEENIDSICLKGVTNSFPATDLTLDFKYREFCEKLVEKLYGDQKDDYRVYDILGDDDFRLIARNVKLGKLLQEFTSGGLLNGHEKQVRFYLFSSSLVLNTDTPPFGTIQEEVIEKTSVEMNKHFQAPLCEQLEKRMLNISGRVKVHGTDDEWKGQEEIATFSSAIWQLLQSLKALEIPDTKKYDFMSIYHPLRQLILILEEKLKDQKGLAKLGAHEDIFDFIHKISMTLHGTLRTDIQFFQIRDFNAIVHYAPSKLRAFYSLWALRLSDYYAEFGNIHSSKSYSFILCPGMFSKVKIKQLFENDDEDNRLMLIAVPERQLYMPKGLSIMLGHEVSHYVGGEVRQRPLRHRVMMGIMARLLALEMNYFRYKNCSAKWRRELERFIADSRLHEKLEEYLLPESGDVYRKWEKVPNRYHSGNSAVMIKERYQELAQTYLEKLIGEECERYSQCLKGENKDIPNREKMALFEEIRKVAYASERQLAFFYQQFQEQLDSFLGMFFHILKEVCADINSVLTLELKPAEYLESFCSSEEDSDASEEESGMASLRIVRLALVLECVKGAVAGKDACFINRDFPKIWTDFKVEDYGMQQRAQSTIQEIALWVYDYRYSDIKNIRNLNRCIGSYQSTYNYGDKCFQAGVVECVKDEVIWEKMYFYGRTCGEKYLEILNKKTDLRKQKKVLVETFESIAKGSVQQRLQAIEDFLFNYERLNYENQ